MRCNLTHIAERVWRSLRAQGISFREERSADRAHTPKCSMRSDRWLSTDCGRLNWLAPPASSGENPPNRFSRILDQPHGTAIDFDFHLFMVQAELAQDRRLKGADVLGVFHCAIADLIGTPVNRSTFNSSAGQPGGKAFWIVIASGRIL